MKEIENLQKENSEIQNKLEENNRKLNFLNKTLGGIENYEKKGKKDIKLNIKSNKKMNIVSIESGIKAPNEEIDIKGSPIYFKFEKTITSFLYKSNYYYNSACIFFSSENNNIYIVFGVRSLDLKYYDLKFDKKYILFPKLHKNYIESCRHFYEEKNGRDLVITASLDNHVKVINFKKSYSEIIVDLDLELNRNQKVVINNACLSKEIIMIPFAKTCIIECYNLDSKLIWTIKNQEIIFDLTLYHCELDKRDYALISSQSGIYAYFINNLTLYRKFESIENQNGKEKMAFNEARIIEENNRITLVGPQFNEGNLYLWNFKFGNLINLINIGLSICDICIWDNNYVLAFSSENKSKFILINIDSKINNKYSIDKIKENPEGKGIKLLRHKMHGDYLLSCSLSGKFNLFSLKSYGL